MCSVSPFRGFGLQAVRFAHLLYSLQKAEITLVEIASVLVDAK